MRSYSGGLVVLAVLAVAGCQPVARFTPPSMPRAAPTQANLPPAAPEPIDPAIGWRNPDPTLMQPDLPIEFVHAETDRAEWARLPDRLWHTPPLFQPLAGGIGLGLPSPFIQAALVYVAGRQPVIIRVPIGLDDPRRFVPADNPLTLHKWQLGRRLFFDKSYLSGARSVSCAGCHLPDHGFTDGMTALDGFNTPTLLNCVYSVNQFWDGRASYLEEVVQRTLEDERESDKPEPFRHVWGGVIRRLNEKERYRREFGEVFGTLPTQDAVGKALATYLRTLLCGNSLNDRARRAQVERGGASLEVGDYEKVLTLADLKALGREEKKVQHVAAELHDGYRLFHNLARNRPANCVLCHGGATFSDNGFHNLGVGLTRDPEVLPARFANLPIGLKQHNLYGAYKTPTLRSLPRTGPYLHNGEQMSLEAVVEFHATGGTWNPYLDPLLLEPDNPAQKRDLHLGKEDVQALTLFLRALNGQDVDPLFKTPPDGE